jgi:hypothetical protein
MGKNIFEKTISLSGFAGSPEFQVDQPCRTRSNNYA